MNYNKLHQAHELCEKLLAGSRYWYMSVSYSGKNHPDNYYNVYFNDEEGISWEEEFKSVDALLNELPGIVAEAFPSESTDTFSADDIKSAIEDAFNPADWEDSSIYHDLTAEENEVFRRGIRYGVNRTLFEMADYFDLTDFFEKEIEPLFNQKRKVE